jgi:glucose-6-phosphate isomerase
VLGDNSPELGANHDDLLLIGLAADADSSGRDVSVSGELGEQLILWEVATAVASRILGVNPFDQPDVESAKIAARAFLESPEQAEGAAFDAFGVSIKSSGLPLEAGKSLEKATISIREVIGSDSYLSVQAYLDRFAYPEATRLRDLLAAKFNRPTTFGWGPRFLHSTGQYHKGGPKQGIFIQILDGSDKDMVIPERDFSFRQLIDSQSGGDAKVLANLGRPVLSIRFKDVASGLTRLASLLS